MLSTILADPTRSPLDDYRESQAQIAALTPPPTLTSMFTGDAPPPLPSVLSTPPATLQPLITTPRMQDEQAIQQRIDAYNNPTKPHGFWQGLRHTLATIGNIAGDIAAPGTMMLIPGTQMYRSMQHAADLSHLNSDYAEDRQDADQSSVNSLRSAQAGEALTRTSEMPQESADAHTSSLARTRLENDQSQQLEHPIPQLDHFASDDGIFSFNPASGEVKQLTFNGKPVGVPKKTQEMDGIIGPDGQPHSYLVDQNGNKIDLGRTYEKPTPEPGSWQLDEGPDGKPVLFNNKTGATRDANGLAKPGTFAKAQAPYQAIVDEATQAHQMADEATKGNAEADVDLALSFFKTMKGSGGSGIRFTQQESSLIQNARSAGQGIQAIAQKVLGGGQMFTPDQRRNVLAVIDLHADAARRHLASMGSSGAPAGTRALTDGGVTYQIPNNQVSAFMKDHPNAR